jgi:hypothetical protein
VINRSLVAAFFHPVLRIQNREYEVGSREIIVGRDDDCHVKLDDERASRRHASFRVAHDTLWVRDLGSRNGVLVNGRRIDSETALRVDDVVTIGGQEIRVLASRVKSGRTTRVSADTLSGEDAVARAPSLDDSWDAADRAFARNDVTEAERVVSERLSATYVAVASGHMDGSRLDAPSRHALRLASATGRAKWIDWVFRAHEAAKKVLPLPILEELDRVARATRYKVGSPMKSYVELLTRQSSALTASERFVASRIQALYRTLLAA